MPCPSLLSMLSEVLEISKPETCYLDVLERLKVKQPLVWK